MAVIINADDLGLNPSVNDTIFDMMAQRCITSATLMANAPAVADAVKRLAFFPQMSFGVHLNLDEFQPLAPSAELAAALDGRGSFTGNFRSIKITRELRVGVLKEWRAQVARLRSLGVRISHLDSHHHVHTMPGLLPVLKQIQLEFGIQKVRLSKNLYARRNRPGWRLLAAKKVWNSALRLWYATRTTSAFTGFEDFLEIHGQMQCAPLSIELMVHPGSPEFDAETNALKTPWREQLSFPIKLISYDAL